MMKKKDMITKLAEKRTKILDFRRKAEEGYTLIEIMVAIVLFAVIGTIITTTIVNLGETTQKFTLSASAQDDVLDTSLTINRDISSASKIVAGTNYSVTLRSVVGATSYDINIFYWNTADSTVAPAGVVTSTLPNQSIVETRKITGAADSTIATQVLVTGYTKANQTAPLFTYYNNNSAVVAAPLTAATAATVQRISHDFYVNVTDRAKPIRMTSSASPRMLS